jgi:hypothetical protein
MTVGNKAHNRKIAQRQALDLRLTAVLASLYHAATPRYPREFGPFADDFDEWLQSEIDGALFWLCRDPEDATGIKGLDAWAMRTRRDGKRDCVIYSHGRGGRTIAPAAWVETRGGSAFRMARAEDFSGKRDCATSWTYAQACDLVRIVEAFRAYVVEWNAGVAEQWELYTAERLNTRDDITAELAQD